MRDQRPPKQRYTGVPDILFDIWLPVIDDCELRVLLVIIRKTVGWRQNEEELSLNGIARLAGVSKSSVVRASGSLIERGLIDRKKNSGDAGEGQSESTYSLKFDDETDGTPEPPTVQPLNHQRTTPEPPAEQPPEPPAVQVIGRDLNTYVQTHSSSLGFAPALQEYRTTTDQLPKLFLSKYTQKRGAKLDPQKHDKAKAKIWLASRSESPDEILSAQECFFADDFWSEAGFPFAAFVSQFQKYLEQAKEMASQDTSGASGRAAATLATVPTHRVEADAPSEVTTKIDYPGRWNELVPAMPVQWDPKRSNVDGLLMATLDDLFVEKFDAICARAQKIHTARPGEQKYLTFNWIIKKEGRKGPWNWFKVLQDYEWMEMPDVARGAKSNIGGPWKPGMPIDTMEETQFYRAWQVRRREKGKHTDPDIAAAEGDIDD